MDFTPADIERLGAWAQIAGVAGLLALALVGILIARRLSIAAVDGFDRTFSKAAALMRGLDRRLLAAVAVSTVAFICLWIAGDEPYETVSRKQWFLLGVSCALAGFVLARRGKE